MLPSAAFSSSSFLPSIPQIVEDLDTTASIINITVAIFILFIGIFPLFWAPYSGVCRSPRRPFTPAWFRCSLLMYSASADGRRPIYLLSLPIFALGCVGTALSHSLVALILTRIVQALGSSPVLSIGAGTISDIYPKQERGTAMGLFYVRHRSLLVRNPRGDRLLMMSIFPALSARRSCRTRNRSRHCRTLDRIREAARLRLARDAVAPRRIRRLGLPPRPLHFPRNGARPWYRPS